MYICTDCNRKFRVPHEYYEKRGLDSPPYERYLVCPACGGSLKEVKEERCKCCGARLPEGVHNYCNKTCKNRGERMWVRQIYHRRKWARDPLARMIEAVDNYNKLNGTRYSYGQYVALIYPKEAKNAGT